jgi:hypothetical protein
MPTTISSAIATAARPLRFGDADVELFALRILGSLRVEAQAYDNVFYRVKRLLDAGSKALIASLTLEENVVTIPF